MFCLSWHTDGTLFNHTLQQATEAAIKERRYFKTSESGKRTVADLINRYFERIQRDNPKRIKDVKPIFVKVRKSCLGN